MEYTTVPLESFPRRKHFEYFSGLAYPYVGLTVNVDITAWLSAIKARGYPFFLCFLHAVTRSANSVPAFRQRIRGGGIIEYAECQSSYTVALPDETYCYCTVACSRPLPDFLEYAGRQQEQAIAEASLEDSGDAQSLFFISSLPWLSYTGLLQPVPMPADSNPRITWGKYFEDSGKTLIPLTVLCHHALVDGIHISQFYDHLHSQLSEVCKELTPCPRSSN